MSRKNLRGRLVLWAFGALSVLFWLWLLKLALIGQQDKEEASTAEEVADEKPLAKVQTPAPDRRRRAKGSAGNRKSAGAKRRRFGVETILLAVEVGAIVLLVVVGLSLWQTRRDLNDVYRSLQKSDPRALPTLMAAANPGMGAQQLAQSQAENDANLPALPTPYPTVTPAAQAATADSQEKVAGEVADEVTSEEVGKVKPEAAQALQQDDVAPLSAIAFGMTEVAGKRAQETGQPRRLQIPAIAVDSFIYQDYGEDWLKLGVVQVGDLVAAGAPGNLVLAGHNDVYGEVFRDLDELEAGHELFVMADNTTHKYRVRETLIVEPDDVWVTLPTSTPTLTLVSCYPYLVGTHRIVVFADLVP